MHGKLPAEEAHDDFDTDSSEDAAPILSKSRDVSQQLDEVGQQLDEVNQQMHAVTASRGFRSAVSGAGRWLLMVGLAGAIFATAIWSLPAKLVGAEHSSMAKWANAAELAQRSRRRDGALVAEVFTFGAPAATRRPLVDESSENGCFSGLRIYSATLKSDFTTDRVATDPVSWITNQFNYSHPKMDSMVLWDQDLKDSPITACGASPSWVDLPAADDLWVTYLHTGYEDLLRAHVEYLKGLSKTSTKAAAEASTIALRRLQALPLAGTGGDLRLRLERAFLMVHFAFMIYQTSPQRLATDARDLGWNLVGTASSLSTSVFRVDNRDRVALYQHPVSLECVLVFEGTDRTDTSDWYADVDGISAPFCDIGEAHEGFRNKLTRMVGSPDYREAIYSKLGYCSLLTVTGHSLGGAQAELFAACANSKEKVDNRASGDHELIAFRKSVPKRLPDFYFDTAGGQFVVNTATGLCLDVRGTMEIEAGNLIGLYDCENKTSSYSQDQKWDFAAGGYIINRHSRLCLGLRSDEGESKVVLTQLFCNESAAAGWEVNSEGYLEHKPTKLCVDGDVNLVACPASDMRWTITSDGFFKNLATGLCLDVEGDSPEAYAKLLVYSCETASINKTDQRWTIEKDGRVRNLISGLCVHSLLNNKDSTQQLVLNGCSEPGTDDPNARDARVDFLLGGFLRTKTKGLCFDVVGHPGGSGAPVVLAPCRFAGFSGRWKHDPEGFIRNVGGDWLKAQLCLEVFGEHDSGEKRQAGAKIHTDVCEIGTDQRWFFESGHMKNSVGARRCMGILKTGEPKHDVVSLTTCYEWLGVYWEYSGDQSIHNLYQDLCIGVYRTSDDNRPKVVVVSCKSISPDIWIHVWLYSPGGHIVETMTGLCLSWTGDLSLGRQVPELVKCGEGDYDQQWTVEDGLITPSKHEGDHACLATSPGAGALDLMGVVLEFCPKSGQTWRWGEGGRVINDDTKVCLKAEEDKTNCVPSNMHAGACVTTSDGKTERLVTSECDPEDARQVWEVLKDW